MNVDTRTGDAVYLQSLNDRIPAGRWGTPDDFKGSAVFLASSASDYVHGHILLVSSWRTVLCGHADGFRSSMVDSWVVKDICYRSLMKRSKELLETAGR